MLDTRDSYGHTPLISAVLLNHQDVVRTLIDAGANTECTTTTYRWSALHIAAAMGNLRIAWILVAAGANRELRDTAGLTPIHLLGLTRYGTELCPVFETMGFDGSAPDGHGISVALKCKTIRSLLSNYSLVFPLLASGLLSRVTGVDIGRPTSIMGLEEGLRYRCMQMLSYEMDKCLGCGGNEGAITVLTDTARDWYIPGIPRRLREFRRSQSWWSRADVVDEKAMAIKLA